MLFYWAQLDCAYSPIGPYRGAMTSDDPSPLRLDDQLCFALHDATRAIVGSYRPLLDAAGLTYSQYLVMIVLWEQEVPVAVGSLCERLHLDSGTLSPMLKRMETRGLITRTRSLRDERAVEIACTARGHSLKERVAAAQVQVCAATGMDAERITALRTELVALTSRLRSRDESATG